jgi:anaerobic dimethyl sulfoxide reductase subunit B
MKGIDKMTSKQYGFYFDQGRCVGCRTCEAACKSNHDLEPGVNWMQVKQEWKGDYPDISSVYFAQACLQCGNAPCIEACPTGAITRRAEDGVVVVDSQACNGCRECLPACPYGVPQFGSSGKMLKCDLCTGIGGEPACITSCPAEALYVGPLDELTGLAKAKGKTSRKMEGKAAPSVIMVK